MKLKTVLLFSAIILFFNSCKKYQGDNINGEVDWCFVHAPYNSCYQSGTQQGAIVTLSGNGAAGSVYTDANGRFSFGYVKKGSYLVTASYTLQNQVCVDSERVTVYTNKTEESDTRLTLVRVN